MTSNHSRPRSRSFSGVDEHLRPKQTKLVLDMPPKPDAARRAPVPRAASSSNLHPGMDAVDRIFDEDSFNIAREHFDRQAMRDLAHFFRTTAPPAARDSLSVDLEPCFRLPVPADASRRWSIQSLRKGKRGSLRRAGSLQLQDKAVPKTTAAGHSYIAISGPPGSRNGPVRSSARSSALYRLPELQRPEFTESLQPEWPQRTSSRGGMPSPTRVDGFTFFNDTTQSARSSRVEDVASLAYLNSRASLDKKPSRPSESDTATTPKIVTHPSPVEEHDSKSIKTGVEIPVVTPPAEPRSMSFSSTTSSRKNSSQFDDNGATSPAQSASPRSLSERRKLSAFPSTAPPRIGSPGSQKQPQKKSANLAIKSTTKLEVPQSIQLPESPGFPKMLASMAFPSPPETSPSHSTNNSISSSANRSISVSPTPARSPKAFVPESDLDNRLMHPSRPPLKHHRSDSAAQVSYMSQRSVATSVSTDDSGTVELQTAQTGQRYRKDSSALERIHDEPETQEPAPVSPVSKDEAAKGDSPDSSGHSDGDSQRQSTISTGDLSWQSAAASDTHRHSIRSDTSATSNATTTMDGSGKNTPSYRDSIDSTSTLTARRRSRLQRQLGGSTAESVESLASSDAKGRTPETRSETPTSIRSNSSVGTNGTSQSLAERRMARKNRVREKFQRDLEASKANATPRAGRVFTDYVDSPVLGWFPQNAPAAQRAARTSSGLANQSPTPKTQTAPHDKGSNHASRRSSVQDIAQLIPETVEEGASPATPTAPDSARLSFSPIMVSVTEPDPEPTTDGEETPTSPALTMSPIMVVANIEGRSPPQAPSNLRPLSLLGGPAPSLPPRSSRRTEGKSSARQRPLPVKIATNPLDLAANHRKTNRNSTPNMPTPPISPDQSSSPYRMSLPLRTMSGDPAQPPTSHPKNKAPQKGRPASSPRDRQTQWLMAHQRKTVEEWRTEALEERTRRERLEKKAAPQASDRSTGIRIYSDDASDVQTNSESEGQPPQHPGDNHSTGGSSATKQRINTLKVLNANADRDSNQSSPTSATTSFPDREGAAASDVGGEGDGSGRGEGIEQRLLRLEQNGDAFMSGIMPLLKNMNSMLAEMRRDSVGHELSSKFLDSAIAASASVEANQRAASHHSQPSPREPEGEVTSAEPSPTKETNAGIQGRPGRSYSVPLEMIAEKRTSPEPGPKPLARSQTVDVTAEGSEEAAPAAVEAGAVRSAKHESKALPPIPDAEPAEESRSPEQLEAEAQVAIRRRIQEQETMMDGMMSKWRLAAPKPAAAAAAAAPVNSN